jgi:hypothetical protein
MILAVVLDGEARPVCSEMWPGNTADVTSLVPVPHRVRTAEWRCEFVVLQIRAIVRPLTCQVPDNRLNLVHQLQPVRLWSKVY